MSVESGFRSETSVEGLNEITIVRAAFSAFCSAATAHDASPKPPHT